MTSYYMFLDVFLHKHVKQMTDSAVVGEYDMQNETEFCRKYYIHILQNNMNMLHTVFNVTTILVRSIYKV